ncbi:MAG: glycosyltransferase family 2 protein [Lachnospiraceae bacterium]|nr:glycosyltransferase family 2 protein [Lachnospiraceae bacterium]
MKVNVAIPTYRPDSRLKEIIIRLNKQTIVPDRILIINTDEEYLSEDDYKQFNNVDIVHITKDQFDHGGTRDMAMKLLVGDYNIYMTQDAMPVNSRLIEELVVPMADDETIAVTYAKQLPSKKAGVIEKYTRAFNYGDDDILTSEDDVESIGIKAYFCSDVCAAYRTAYYDEIGGFPLKTIFNEDMIYASRALKASYRKLYASKALVVHSHNYSAWQQFTRNFDLGVSHKQFPEVFNSKMKTENEGIRLVMDTAKYLIESEEYLLLPKLVLHSGAKFVGYRLGKLYDKLPKDMVELCTMNKNYWV